MMLRFLILLHLLTISWFAKAYETNFLGAWKLVNENAGVEAMQCQLLPNNKFVWFDTTALGDSALKLEPPGYCPKNFENVYNDCFAHAVEFDIATYKVRPLELRSDPWCSSGVLSLTGQLIVTGGFNKGIKSVRIFPPCPTPVNCANFQEAVDVLGSPRWYASNAILEDGSFIVLGGRTSFDYEILPPDTLQFPKKVIPFPFLMETTDRDPRGPYLENNLYPFLYLNNDGNALLFANDRAVIFEPKTGKIIRKLPNLPGGSRNYPASGSAVLLPIDLRQDPSGHNVVMELMICGGSTHEAFMGLEGIPLEKKNFVPALQDCGRLQFNRPGAQWEIEIMPSRRVMPDMLNLPNGEILILGGAETGTAAWWNADIANLTPVKYRPNDPPGARFKNLAPTTIPRMYHSIHAIMPDTKVLAAGSNPHDRYVYQSKYVTELRVETFDPPYLDPALDNQRAVIIEGKGTDIKWKHATHVSVTIKLDQPVVNENNLMITLYAPPFTSHGFSMNQRLIICKIVTIELPVVRVVAPPHGRIAPPGYYLLFVIYNGVPSKGVWINMANL